MFKNLPAFPTSAKKVTTLARNVLNITLWKLVFHGGVSSFYLSLMATYWSSGNVVFVERMVTTWYLAIHIGFIFMALGLDVVNLLLDKSSKIARSFTAFNNLIFISVVFPFGLFVPLTYWSLFFYNYNLILPNIVEITVPNWVSTSSHSVISLVALLEMITTKYTYKGNYILALTMMTVFSASYITCLIGTYVQFGFWVYPVLHLVPEEELWMVFLALAAKLVALFFFGAGVSFLIHGDGCKNTSQTVPDNIPTSSTGPKNSPLSNSKNIPNEMENSPEIWHDAFNCLKPVLNTDKYSNHDALPSNQKFENISSKIQTPGPFAAQGKFNPHNQQSPSSTINTNNTTLVRSELDDDAITMSNVPAPMIDDDITMDSLDIILIPPPPPSSLFASPSEPILFSECKRRKVKQNFLNRKEKLLKSTTSTSSANHKNTSTSTSISSYQDVGTMTEPNNSNIYVTLEKKDKKKRQSKENKEAKGGSKEFLKKLSFPESNTGDRWSCLEAVTRKISGKLESECTDFETRSLPTDVDEETGVKKRDYRRGVSSSEIASCLVFSNDKL